MLQMSGIYFYYVARLQILRATALVVDFIHGGGDFGLVICQESV